MKKKLTLKLIESNDTPKIGDLVKRDNLLLIVSSKLLNSLGNIVNQGIKLIKPIAISDEEIKVGDKFLNDYNEICELTDKKPTQPQFDLVYRRLKDNSLVESCYTGKKIELLPEHFSNDIKQLIVDDKLKDGDEIEVEYICSCESDIEAYDSCGYNCRFYKLKLDSNNKAICSIPETYREKSFEDANYMMNRKEVSKIMYSEEDLEKAWNASRYYLNFSPISTFKQYLEKLKK